MEYEDKKLEEMLSHAGKSVEPSRAVSWRILNALPVSRKSWYWMLGILTPALAVLIFVFISHKQPEPVLQVVQEDIAFDEELAQEDISLFEELDFFEDDNILETL